MMLKCESCRRFLRQLRPAVFQPEPASRSDHRRASAMMFGRRIEGKNKLGGRSRAARHKRHAPFFTVMAHSSRARARRLVETTAQRLTSTGQDGSMAGGWWCGSDPALRS
jgi:hypothetical protein